MLKFQSIIIEGVDVVKRKNIIEENRKWVSTVFQLRTVTNNKIIGELAKEGVHSDGVEHTMTSLLYTQNMIENSAISEMPNQY